MSINRINALLSNFSLKYANKTFTLTQKNSRHFLIIGTRNTGIIAVSKERLHIVHTQCEPSLRILNRTAKLLNAGFHTENIHYSRDRSDTPSYMK